MSNIKEFKVIESNQENKPSGDNVIERLEQALAMAKDGGIANVVIMATLDNGDVMDCWANGGSPFVVVGGLESIKREFMDSCIEAR